MEGAQLPIAVADRHGHRVDGQTVGHIVGETGRQQVAGVCRLVRQRKRGVLIRAFNHRGDPRTIRDFAPTPIPDGVLEWAVRAAGTAPSGAHVQPWRFATVSQTYSFPLPDGFER